MVEQHIKNAEDAGVSANRSGIPKTLNPYVMVDLKLKEAWDRGWQRSCDQQSKARTF